MKTIYINVKRPCLNTSFRAGFTLIELLVVVLIIGILAAVALPQYQKAVYKARYTQLITLVDSVARAQEVYKLANGEYTARFGDLDIEMPAGGTLNQSSDIGAGMSYPKFTLGLLTTGHNVAYGSVRGTPLNYYYYYDGRKECRTAPNNADGNGTICLTLGAKFKGTNAEYDLYVF